MNDIQRHSEGYTEIQLLIVDDDEVSIMAVKRALKKMKLANPTQIAHDGVEALDILRAAADANGTLPPFIVLLDINMPRMNGHEFLEQVRSDPTLHQVVIFVLTTSNLPEDVRRATDQDVAGYVIKENPYESLAKNLESTGAVSRLLVVPNQALAGA